MCTLFDVRKHSALQTQGVDTLHKKDVYGLWRDKMRQGRDCEAQCCIRPHAHTKDEAQLQEDMAGCGLGGMASAASPMLKAFSPRITRDLSSSAACLV